MNYMKKVADMLGVELDEEFKIVGEPGVYVLTEDGSVEGCWGREMYDCHKGKTIKADEWQTFDNYLQYLLAGWMKVSKAKKKSKL